MNVQDVVSLIATKLRMNELLESQKSLSIIVHEGLGNNFLRVFFSKIKESSVPKTKIQKLQVVKEFNQNLKDFLNFRNDETFCDPQAVVNGEADEQALRIFDHIIEELKKRGLFENDTFSVKETKLPVLGAFICKEHVGKQRVMNSSITEISLLSDTHKNCSDDDNITVGIVGNINISDNLSSSSAKEKEEEHIKEKEETRMDKKEKQNANERALGKAGSESVQAEGVPEKAMEEAVSETGLSRHGDGRNGKSCSDECGGGSSSSDKEVAEEDSDKNQSQLVVSEKSSTQSTAEIIKSIAVENPAYANTDFCAKFLEIVHRLPTIAEKSLFINLKQSANVLTDIVCNADEAKSPRVTKAPADGSIQVRIISNVRSQVIVRALPADLWKDVCARAVDMYVGAEVGASSIDERKYFVFLFNNNPISSDPNLRVDQVNPLREKNAPLIVEAYFPGDPLDPSLTELPSIDDILAENARTSPTAPVENYLFVCTDKAATLAEANVEQFKADFCALYDVSEEVILHVDVALGSCIYRAVTEINMKLRVVKDGKKYRTEKIDIRKSNFTENVHRILNEHRSKQSHRKMLQTEKRTFLFKLDTVLLEFSLTKEMYVLSMFIRSLLEKSRLKLQLHNITKYVNRNFEDRFYKQVKESDRLAYLCHGSEGVGHMKKHDDPGLMLGGFDPDHKCRDGGWFGQGFYLTSYIDYALIYQYKRGNMADVIAEMQKNNTNKHLRFNLMYFLCNLGVCEEVNVTRPVVCERTSFIGKNYNKHQDPRLPYHSQPLPTNIDTRHVMVGQEEPGSMAFYPEETTFNPALVFDEYVFKDRYHALPSYILAIDVLQEQHSMEEAEAVTAARRERETRDAEGAEPKEREQKESKKAATVAAAEQREKEKAAEAQRETNAAQAQRETNAAQAQRETNAAEEQRETNAAEEQRETNAAAAEVAVSQKEMLPLTPKLRVCVLTSPAFTLEKRDVCASGFVAEWRSRTETRAAGTGTDTSGCGSNRMGMRALLFDQNAMLSFTVDGTVMRASLQEEMRVLDMVTKSLLAKSLLNLQLLRITRFENSTLEDDFFGSVTDSDHLAYLCRPPGSDEEQGESKEMVFGFRSEQEARRGRFGRGITLTSYLDYAVLRHLKVANIEELRAKLRQMGKDGSAVHVNVFLCRLGTCEELNVEHPHDGTGDLLPFRGEQLPPGIHVRHVLVGQAVPDLKFYPLEATVDPALVFDEYTVDDARRLLPSYVLTLSAPPQDWTEADTKKMEELEKRIQMEARKKIEKQKEKKKQREQQTKEEIIKIEAEKKQKEEELSRFRLEMEERDRQIPFVSAAAGRREQEMEMLEQRVRDAAAAAQRERDSAAARQRDEEQRVRDAAAAAQRERDSAAARQRDEEQRVRDAAAAAQRERDSAAGVQAERERTAAVTRAVVAGPVRQVSDGSFPYAFGFTCAVCSVNFSRVVAMYHCESLLCNDFNLCEDCFKKGDESVAYQHGGLTCIHSRTHPIALYPPFLVKQAPASSLHSFLTSGLLDLPGNDDRREHSSHPRYNCDGCKKKIHTDTPRFHCNTCIDFDLCNVCYYGREDIKNHTRFHTVTKVLHHRRTVIATYPSSHRESLYLAESPPTLTFTSTSLPKIKYISNPYGGVVFCGPNHMNVSFTSDSTRSVFLKVPIEERVWKLTVAVSNFSTKSSFRFGAARMQDMDRIMKGCLGDVEGDGVCFLAKLGGSYINTAGGARKALPSYFDGTNGEEISLEVEMDTHMMRFAKGDEEVPYAIKDVPDAIHLGYGSKNVAHVVRFVCLQRLVKATLLVVKNKKYISYNK